MLARNKRRRKSQIIKNLNDNIVNLSFDEEYLKSRIKKACKRMNNIQKVIDIIESSIESDINSYNYNCT